MSYLHNTECYSKPRLEWKPIIAIDGPAGTGKSTVACRVAQKLELLYLDTGAMYRALTWLVLNAQISLDDESAIAELASTCEIRFNVQSPLFFGLHINGHEVTDAIRTPEVTVHVASVAAQPAVRTALVRQQQAYGQQGGVIAEGRDIGTHVFPNADLKIFLTASLQERAKRRLQDMRCQGIFPLPSLEELESSIYNRDLKDYTRNVSPLMQAEDAASLVTDGLTLEEVVAQVISLYQRISLDHQAIANSVYPVK